MKVSVLIVTYNHEAYISAAINSALDQVTNFPFEIVVGEDASSDRNREIVLDFQRQHPDVVRVLLADTAQSERERAEGIGGRTNFIDALKACKGLYIAWLDGDDYWTDVHKLQKQVDFLDSHPDFAMSCHNVTMLSKDGSKPPVVVMPPDHKEVLSLEDLLADNVIPASSVVFRRGLFGELPDWFFELKFGDWPIHIMNAQYGKIGYMNEVMTTYRVHEGGVWSARNLVNQRLDIIKMLQHVDAHLGFKYKKQIRASQANWYWEIAQECYRQDDRIQGRGYARKYFWMGGFRARRNVLGFFLKLRTPTLYHSLRSLRHFFSSVKSNSLGVMGS